MLLDFLVLFLVFCNWPVSFSLELESVTDVFLNWLLRAGGMALPLKARLTTNIKDGLLPIYSSCFVSWISFYPVQKAAGV